MALCLTLGACSALSPAGPSVTATAGQDATEQKFAGDVTACRARAQAAAQTVAITDQAGRQNKYDATYSDCVLERGYTVSQPVARK